MSAAPSLSLRRVVRRAQIRVAMVATLVVATLLAGASALLLRLAEQHSLDLVARSMAYSVDAAVMFRDATAAQGLLDEMARSENLVEARLLLPDGRTLALHRRAPPHTLAGRLAAGLPGLRAVQPVQANDQVIGTLRLQSDAGWLLKSAGWALLGVLAGAGATAVGIARASRELQRLIGAPLLALSTRTQTIRAQRRFDLRVPLGGATEIQALGQDVNALLAQVQQQQNDLRQRHAALQSEHEQLAHQSRRDALTGVANRAWFEQQLATAIDRARAHQERLAVLFIDVDDFKDVNDRYGHEAGDRVLTALASRLCSSVREHDLVGRLGGDEFVILIDPLRQPEDAQALLRQLSRTVAAPLEPDLASGLPTRRLPELSIGAAIFPDDGDSVDALLREADRQMYRRKPAPRGRP